MCRKKKDWNPGVTESQDFFNVKELTFLINPSLLLYRYHKCFLPFFIYSFNLGNKGRLLWSIFFVVWIITMYVSMLLPFNIDFVNGFWNAIVHWCSMWLCTVKIRYYINNIVLINLHYHFSHKILNLKKIFW